MRHFLADLIDPARHAPRAGFMHPWRFIRMSCADLRKAVHGLVEQERILTAKALNARL